MPKMKTHQATAKRFTIKRGKGKIKILKRTDGKDHFNARESGKVTRNKRGNKLMSPTLKLTILRGMPNQ